MVVVGRTRKTFNRLKVFTAPVDLNHAERRIIVFSLIGFLIVLGAVVGGFMEAGGPPAVLLQIAEFIVIGGAAIGSLIIAAPGKVLGALAKNLKKALASSCYNREQYMELFHLLYEVFSIMRKNGEMALEKDVDDPANSAVFSKYPGFIRNTEAKNLLCDSLRLVISGSTSPSELAQLMDEELATYDEESRRPAALLSKVADALPGLGIVAAVLGVIIAMASIDQGSTIVGQKIAAALVGTFLGVLLSYGLFQPLTTKLEFLRQEEARYLECIKTGLLANLHGAAPIIAIEHARRVMFSGERPSALELERECRGSKQEEDEEDALNVA
jgi:chemotaxis protein MotA